MAGMVWPDDHPNAKVLAFVEGSRLVLSRAGDSPVAASTGALLDRIESLVGEMSTARTRAEVEQLVGQVGPLMNEAVARMDVVRRQILGSSSDS